ncbi:MAG TPA: DUF423 domain-containing protein [Vicinamibacterales bacterium]|nr:DUF423 domain-containing protein [Vicinamibacterales bacterium]
MDTTFMLVGALAGFLGVAAGAFGAHGLRSRLSPEMLAVFETAVRYQMYHVFALLITAAVIGRMGDARLLSMAGWSFVAGIVLFSGSLFALTLTGITTLGAITPLGGVAFLIGWACLAIFAALR